jgi:hypothetical protein
MFATKYGAFALAVAAGRCGEAEEAAGREWSGVEVFNSWFIAARL